MYTRLFIKKVGTRFDNVITTSNIDRFLKFFY